MEKKKKKKRFRIFILQKNGLKPCSKNIIFDLLTRNLKFVPNCNRKDHLKVSKYPNR